MLEVKLENVSLSVDSWTVVHIDKLYIKNGEYVCIQGRSGAGKSTLLSILSLLRKPTSGRVIFNKHVVRWKGDHTNLRRMYIAIIPQKNYLIRTLTVWENIGFPLILENHSLRYVRSTVEKLAYALGIAHILDRKPCGISGGEARRIVIARALATKRPILIADEPTAGLDNLNTRRVLYLLGKIARHSGIVIHAEPVFPEETQCSKKYVIRDGVLVEA